ncbi:MAG: hypothetical protein ABI624_23095 [Casimicrobiaceae bacterium]
MRIGLVEGICIVAIGVATLQLPSGEGGTRLFTPPAMPVLKNLVLAHDAAPQERREYRNRRSQ